MAETNNILIVQAWIKSTIFSVQIWSHLFIFYRITLNPTAFTERVYCLSVKASPSPENYSRTPRDYSLTTKGVSLFKTQTESCPAPPRSYAGLWRTAALSSRRPAVSGVGRVTAPRASLQVTLVWTARLHCSTFSSFPDLQHLFLKVVTEWLGLRAFLPQTTAVGSGSPHSSLPPAL